MSFIPSDKAMHDVGTALLVSVIEIERVERGGCGLVDDDADRPAPGRMVLIGNRRNMMGPALTDNLDEIKDVLSEYGMIGTTIGGSRFHLIMDVRLSLSTKKYAGPVGTTMFLVDIIPGAHIEFVEANGTRTHVISREEACNIMTSATTSGTSVSGRPETPETFLLPSSPPPTAKSRSASSASTQSVQQTMFGSGKPTRK